MRPAPLPGGLQLTRKSSSCATHTESTEVASPAEALRPTKPSLPVTSAGPPNAVQQQRKRRKVRGNECNAPPAGLSRATNIVSGYTLPPRRCITHCRLRAIRSRHSRFVTVHNPEFSLERALDGAQVAIGDFSGHGLWGHHISSQAHPPPLPGSPLAFPRAFAAQSKQAHLGTTACASQPAKHREPRQDTFRQQHGVCCGAPTPSFCCFAHSGRPRDRNDSCGNPLMPV